MLICVRDERTIECNFDWILQEFMRNFLKSRENGNCEIKRREGIERVSVSWRACFQR